MRGWIKERVRRLRGDERGLAAIELALFAPVLATLLLSGYDIARYISIRSNVDKIGFFVADVTAQYKELSNESVDQVFMIPGSSMPAYQSGVNGVTILTSVYLDSNNVARVKWQCYSTATSTWRSAIGTEGQPAAVPAGLMVDQTKDTLMVAEVYYRFQPIFVRFFTTSHMIYTASMYRPRLGSLSTKPSKC